MGPAARRDDFYTALWNYLDCTAAVFPVTTVDKTRDAPAPPHAFYNHEDEAMYKLCESLLTSRLGSPARASRPRLGIARHVHRKLTNFLLGASPSSVRAV